MVENPLSYSGRRAAVQWLALTVVGWLLLLGVMMLLTLLRVRLSDAAVVLVGVALLAAAALLQWVVLRPYGVHPWGWTVATCAGFAGGSFVAFPLKLQDWYVPPSGFQLDEVAFGAVLGLVLGGAQWLALRGHIRRAGWWIAASTVGWALGAAAGEILPLDWEQTSAALVYPLVVVSVAAAVTGAALMALLPGRRGS